MTKQDAVAHFNEAGFAKVSQFFKPNEVQGLRAEVARYQRDIAPYIDPFDKMEKHDEPGRFTLLGRMDTHDPFFKSLLNDARLTGLAKKLLGGDVTPQHLQFFNIIPGFGGPTPPHQDAFNFLIDPSHAVAFWIPLQAVNSHNGCLRYVKGSHRQGHRHHKRKFRSTWIVDPFVDKDREEEVGLPAEPGDLLAHHCFTIHRSEPNHSEAERWAIAAIYYTSPYELIDDRSLWLEKYGPATPSDSPLA